MYFIYLQKKKVELKYKWFHYWVVTGVGMSFIPDFFSQARFLMSHNRDLENVSNDFLDLKWSWINNPYMLNKEQLCIYTLLCFATFQQRNEHDHRHVLNFDMRSVWLYWLNHFLIRFGLHENYFHTQTQNSFCNFVC